MGIGINAKLVKFAIISAQKILPAGHEIVFCIAISQQNLPLFYRLPCKTALSLNFCDFVIFTKVMLALLLCLHYCITCKHNKKRGGENEGLQSTERKRS